MSCRSSLLDNKLKINSMLSFGLNFDLAAQIFEKLNTDITHVISNNGKEVESDLYNNLLSLYKNTSVAAKAAAVVFSEDFLELYGNWINDKTIETLNAQGMPALYYYVPESRRYYNNIEDAYSSALYYAIKDTAGELLAYSLASKYRNIIYDINRLKDGEEYLGERNKRSKDLFELAVNLKKYGPILFKTNIETGFVRANDVAAHQSIRMFEYNDVSNFISNGVLPNSNPLMFLLDFNSDELLSALNKVQYNGDRTTRQSSITINSENGLVSIRINATINNDTMNKLKGKLKLWWNSVKTSNPEYVNYLQKSNKRLINFLTGVGVYTVLQNSKELTPEATNFGILFENFASSTIGVIADISGQTSLFDSIIADARINKEYSERMQGFLLQNNTVFGLVTAIANSDSKLANIAKILIEGSSSELNALSLAVEDKPWRVILNGTERITDGAYNQNTVTISKQVYNYPDAIILHEVIHGITHDRINNISEYKEQALSIYNKAKELIFKKYKVNSQKELEEKIGVRPAYGFRNVDEFFAELWTNSNFIKLLSELGNKTKKSLLLKIKDFLLNVIGINETSDVYQEANNLLLDIVYNTQEQVSALLSKESIDSINNSFSDLFEVVPAEEQQDDLKIPFDDAIAGKIELNKGQQDIVKNVTDLYTSKKSLKIAVIFGKAGTGKTTVCPEIIRSIIEKTNKTPNVEVISLANVAKNIIKNKFINAGILVQAKSVAGFLAKRETVQNGERVWSLGSPLEVRAARANANKIDILFVDEASMLSDNDINLIKQYASNALIIFIGDPGQLKAVSNTTILSSPVFGLNADYKGELTERVRLSTESPILDYSDAFGELSRHPEGYKYLDVVLSLQEINTDNLNSSVVSINAINNDDIVKLTFDLVKKAHSESDYDYFGIITHFNKTREELNRKIRVRLLQDIYGIQASEDPNSQMFIDNIPYKDKEMVILYKPYKNEVDNGVKGIVRGDSDVKTLKLPTNEAIQYNTINFEYSDGQTTTTVEIPYLVGKNIKKYLAYINWLTEKAKTAQPSMLGLWWKIRKEAEDFFGLIAPIWALNVHKAQGSTYKTTYIPVLDFLDLEQVLRRNNDETAIVSAISSSLYTAMTRSSDATIFGYKWFVNQLMPDVVTKVTEIEKLKKPLGKVIVEDITGVPLNNTKDVIVTKDTKRYYDFIVFATGSDDLYKRLATEDGWDEFKTLVKRYTLRTNELFKLGRRFEDITELNGEYDYRGSLKDPEILRYKITPERLSQLELKYGAFPSITKINVKPALTIVPPFFAESFKLGKIALSEITPEYFRSVNSRYKTTAKNQDLYVRLHNGSYNVAITEDLQDISKYGLIITPKIDESGYRLDINGERMYQLPKGSIMTKDSRGNEYIIIHKNNAVQDIDNLLNTTQLLVSIQPLFNNINDMSTAKLLINIADRRSKFQTTYFNSLIKKDPGIATLKASLSTIYNDKNALIIYERKFANTLYLSFVKALHVSSSRIPTQALASFMDMLIAAFNPSGANDIFVSRWLTWLLGSDYDIDKSYLMGYSFSPIGLFEHWSSLADYSSEERRMISDELSIPNGIIIKESDINYSMPDAQLELLVQQYLQSNSTDKFSLLKDIINHFDTVKEFNISEELLNVDGVKLLIRLINKHNSTTINNNIAGNILLEKITKICSDIANVQSAHSPIDGATSRLTKALEELDSDLLGSEWDGLAIYKLQEDNLTGKKVVGVMANALKAFLSITLYLNMLYLKGDFDIFSRAYFLNSITIDGTTYNMSSLANTNIDGNIIHILSNALLQVAKVPDKILLTDDDVSIILSACVTLATDNAKELALAKLKASLNLASMHTYLAMMGVPFDKIVTYTAKSSLFNELYSFTQADSWENIDGNISAKSWRVLENQARNGAEYTLDDIKLLSNLYNWAQELKRFTSILGINQGMKSRLINAVQFKANFRNLISQQLSIIESRANQNKDMREPYFKINSVENLLQHKALSSIISLHGLLENESIIKFYQDKISNYILKYGNTSDFTIDFEKYFRDDFYREQVTDLYDIVKSTINMLDVINNLPHFYLMLKGLEETYEKTSSGVKGTFIFNYLVNNYDKINTDIREEDLKDRIPYSINENILRSAINFVDDYIISDFLVNYGKNKNFSFYSNGKTYNIDFSNNVGLKLFHDFFELLIPRLKKKFPDIETFKLLSYYEDKKGRLLIRFNFNIDALDRKNVGEQQLLYNLVVGGFNSVKDIKINSSGLFENADTDLTIGDVFYLYNLIFNLGLRGQNSLVSILGDYVSNSDANGLPTQYYQTMIQYDTFKLTIDTSDGSFIKNYLLQYLYKKNSIPNEFKNLILYNIQNVKTDVDTTETLLKFVEAYRNGIIDIEMDLNCN